MTLKEAHQRAAAIFEDMIDIDPYTYHDAPSPSSVAFDIVYHLPKDREIAILEALIGEKIEEN